MAKHTSIEVLKNIVVGKGIYSNTIFLENDIISSSFNEPIIISTSDEINKPIETAGSFFHFQPGIKYNDEKFYWEFTHGLPNKWNKLNVIEYKNELPEIPTGLNEGIYIDQNGQVKYNFISDDSWLNLSMEVIDQITDER